MHKENIYKKLTSYRNPISIEKFIEISLYDQDGYYTDSNILGKQGDFITSPEISQLFGEILGLYILNYWQNNIKKKFSLLELGPGKGTLLLDILRITKKFDNFNKDLKIELVEKNYNLIKKQKKNLCNYNLDLKNINWSNDFKKNYEGPIIVVANEFFDCLPIKQFFKKDNIWYEKMVNYEATNKIFKLKNVKVDNQNVINEINSYNPIDILELSKYREQYFSKICKQLSRLGGMMITIDYGYLEKPKNFTLQSIFKNKHSNVLDNIGCQDITSLVDFKSLISIAKSYNLKIDTFTTQRNFLIQNGIYIRAKKILNNCNTSKKDIIESGLKRIIDENNMGSLFKVLVISK